MLPLTARALVVTLAALAASGGAFAEQAKENPMAPNLTSRSSISRGLPWNGRLIRGVQLPEHGEHFFTWDPVRKRKPNRGWRRYGNSRVVRTVLEVLDAFAANHPLTATRVGIGDLSLPRGGGFQPLHASHQNGLDVDVYYPRKDRRELAPRTPGQVDRLLAQELVDLFLAAGASRIFTGPSLGLRGPKGIVEPLAHHDNHLHVRFPWGAPRAASFGRSARGRALRVTAIGDPQARRRLLVVGCIHGTECEGMQVTRQLISKRLAMPRHREIWIVHNLNPDGLALGRRQNARGVDLNRNFPSQWQRIGRRGDPQHSGPYPLSEPEARAVRSLILRLRPWATIWFHQPEGLVRAWGRSRGLAGRYAELAGLEFRAIPWPAGTAPNWQNRRFRRGSSFVVELPAGPLDAKAASRHVEAIRGLAAGR